MNEASAAIISGFVTDLELHFRPHKHPTPKSRMAWLKTITEALRGSSPEVLDRAKRRIIENRANQYFPLVAEIRKACREAADEIRFDQHVQTLPTLRAATGTYWGEDRKTFAAELIKGAPVMAREAAKDGWILALRDFARTHGRLPSPKETYVKDPVDPRHWGNISEVEFCKISAREFTPVYARALSGQMGSKAAEYANTLGSSMLAKREKLSAEVLGKPDISRTA